MSSLWQPRWQQQQRPVSLPPSMEDSQPLDCTQSSHPQGISKEGGCRGGARGAHARGKRRQGKGKGEPEGKEGKEGKKGKKLLRNDLRRSFCRSFLPERAIPKRFAKTFIPFLPSRLTHWMKTHVP